MYVNQRGIDVRVNSLQSEHHHQPAGDHVGPKCRCPAYGEAGTAITKPVPSTTSNFYSTRHRLHVRSKAGSGEGRCHRHHLALEHSASPSVDTP